MRTTLTLDDDVAAKLKAAARRTGRPFRDVVNDAIRRGLLSERPGRRVPFRVRTRSLGGVRPGLQLDNIGELLERVEGPPPQVILVDANLLLYAYDPDSPHHDASRRWLEDALSGSDLVRFTWLALWAFVRIATSPRVFALPLSGAEAHAAVASWLQQPNAGIVEPGERHLELLGTLLQSGQAAGAHVMDAALAAVAIEHGATLCSTDRDFSRFDGLDWRNPIPPLTPPR